ncbi:MAG: hypothetical protein ACHQAY_13185 [Hyphomicrobiales bacterium]
MIRRSVGSAERGRRRPRFRVALAILASLTLLSACAGFGSGIAELPATSGWQRLPVRSWLLNEGFGAATIVYCPAQSCARPAMVATFSAEGETALRLMRSLADPKALLLAKRVEVAVARDPRFKRKAASEKPKSSEHAEPVAADGLSGYRVTLSSDVAGGHVAYAVVLAKRDADAVKVALAVTTDPDAALQDARAAARTF